MVLQEYLRGGGTLEALAETYAVKAVWHKTYPNMILSKYNQIASDMSLPLVRECRGVILDEADDWRVVGRSSQQAFCPPLVQSLEWHSHHISRFHDTVAL